MKKHEQFLPRLRYYIISTEIKYELNGILKFQYHQVKIDDKFTSSLFIITAEFIYKDFEEVLAGYCIDILQTTKQLSHTDHTSDNL